MKLAQTNLSEFAESHSADAPASWTAPVLWRFSRGGQTAAEDCRSPRPCGVSDARRSADFQVCCESVNESQRDSGPKPRVARSSQPWVGGRNPVGIVRNKPKDPKGDALHLALASVYKCDMLLSWNCRHIVNYQKAGFLKQLNSELGMGVPMLVTPMELLNRNFAK